MSITDIKAAPRPPPCHGQVDVRGVLPYLLVRNLGWKFLEGGENILPQMMARNEEVSCCSLCCTTQMRYSFCVLVFRLGKYTIVKKDLLTRPFYEAFL
ncbi:hypothetical protein CDAR_11521 [Caerostris darwini]|uniref:Uncharacterized protein n=1 Tax=Caerostris darwini TaxID=1538125 RepID=A0AAV4RE75_9ARAC|nr:hypothetical protein CDAR_11521 [Caerostris darwini]